MTELPGRDDSCIYSLFSSEWQRSFSNAYRFVRRPSSTFHLIFQKLFYSQPNTNGTFLVLIYLSSVGAALTCHLKALFIKKCLMAVLCVQLPWEGTCTNVL